MSVMKSVFAIVRSIFAEPERIDLEVPFGEKDEAKRLGARWDPGKKVWFVTSRHNLVMFERWIGGSNALQRVYLTVPFQEKDEARKLGARWDPDRRVWYIQKGVDEEKFSRWLPQLEKVDFGDYLEIMGSKARYYVHRDNGSMGMGIHTDDLDGARSFAKDALDDGDEVELRDNETGQSWFGSECLGR